MQMHPSGDIVSGDTVSGDDGLRCFFHSNDSEARSSVTILHDTTVNMQVVHLVALHVLFASLAYLAAATESPMPRLQSPDADGHAFGPLEAFSALWHYNEVQCIPHPANVPYTQLLVASSLSRAALSFQLHA